MKNYLIIFNKIKISLSYNIVNILRRYNFIPRILYYWILKARF